MAASTICGIMPTYCLFAVGATAQPAHKVHHDHGPAIAGGIIGGLAAAALLAVLLGAFCYRRNGGRYTLTSPCVEEQIDLIPEPGMESCEASKACQNVVFF